MRLFDVRRLRWVDVELPRHHKVLERQILERLSPAGEMYFNEYSFVANNDPVAFAHLWKRSLATGESVSIDPAGQEPADNAAMTKDGHYYYVSSTQLVVVISPDETVRTFEPLPRRVVQACHVDLEAGVMASGSWGEIALHRIVGDRIVPIDRVRTTGNVSWIAFEEPWLVGCVEGVIRIWPVGENTIGPERHHHDAGVSYDSLLWNTGAISRDGRYLAMGIDRRVVVHDLEKDLVVEYEGHTDDICLVRFVGSDQMLITADEDNRVILRPRTLSGYARSVIDIDVPDDPIKLALDEELAAR